MEWNSRGLDPTMRNVPLCQLGRGSTRLLLLGVSFRQQVLGTWKLGVFLLRICGDTSRKKNFGIGN